MIILDGESYNLCWVSLSRNFNLQDKYLEPTADGDYKRELVGVYYAYTLNFGAGIGLDSVEYQRFWMALSQHKDFHEITLPRGNEEYTFRIYVTEGSDVLINKLNGYNVFANLSITFYSKSLERSPFGDGSDLFRGMQF